MCALIGMQKKKKKIYNNMYVKPSHFGRKYFETVVGGNKIFTCIILILKILKLGINAITAGYNSSLSAMRK